MSKRRAEDLPPPYVNTFFQEDCVAGARAHLPDESVDLVLCDPPYGIQGATLDKHYNRDEQHVLGGYVDVKAEEYKTFTENWVAEAARVLKPGGNIFVVSGYTHLPEVIDALENNNLNPVLHLIWQYNFGVWTTRKYISSHYHVLFYEKETNRGDPPPDVGDMSILDKYGTVWYIKREYQRGETKNKNQLPTLLLERLIRLGTCEVPAGSPRPLVADFFLGSFSTARTAIALGRDATGFEVNAEAFAHWEPVTRALLASDKRQRGMRQTTLDFSLRGDGLEKHRLPTERIIIDEHSCTRVERGGDYIMPSLDANAPSVDLVITWHRVGLPPPEWFRRVANRLVKGGTVYYVARSESISSALKLLREAGLVEVNHIIWEFRRNKEECFFENHLHVLFYEKPGAPRAFFPYAIYSKAQRLSGTDRSANYADRQDVWREGWTSFGYGPWATAISKMISYSCGTRVSNIASFAADENVKAKVTEKGHVFVEE